MFTHRHKYFKNKSIRNLFIHIYAFIYAGHAHTPSQRVDYLASQQVLSLMGALVHLRVRGPKQNQVC